MDSVLMKLIIFATIIMTTVDPCEFQHRAATCFRGLFKTQTIETSSCDSLERLEPCFQWRGCDEENLAKIASQQYSYTYPGRVVPPEVFANLRKQLRIACATHMNNCADFADALQTCRVKLL